MIPPDWFTPEQQAAYDKGASDGDAAWESRPRRTPAEAPWWYTDRQKQEWADAG